MVGTASAGVTVPVSNYKADVGDTTPPNTAITAIYDGNTVIVQATSTTGATSLPPNFDIDTIAIYSPGNTLAGYSAPNGETWTITADQNVPDMFRPISVEYGGLNSPSYKNGGPIELTFTHSFGSFSSYRSPRLWREDESNFVGNGKMVLPQFLNSPQ